MGRGYNTGWCNYCNGNFCPCGGCGCGGNSCSCGRKTVLQQSVSSCCNSSTGTRFCKEPVIYVTDNFVVPAANIEAEVEVSNSARLYKGQGIRIGTGVFQITDIVDDRNINVAHNGTATPNTTITAINPSYGCYAYPIYYVGLVELSFDVEDSDIEGLDASYDPVASSVIDPVLSYTYGYLGPDKVQVNVELEAEIANTPEFISIPLPDAAVSGTASFSAYILINDVPTVLVAFKKGTDLIIGHGGGTNFTNGTGRTIYVSGEYGV